MCNLSSCDHVLALGSSGQIIVWKDWLLLHVGSSCWAGDLTSGMQIRSTQRYPLRNASPERTRHPVSHADSMSLPAGSMTCLAGRSVDRGIPRSSIRISNGKVACGAPSNRARPANPHRGRSRPVPEKNSGKARCPAAALWLPRAAAPLLLPPRPSCGEELTL